MVWPSPAHRARMGIRGVKRPDRMGRQRVGVDGKRPSRPTLVSPDRYREYSAPWFDGQHRVLRGGSHATLPLMHHPRYRNYFAAGRSDVFAGFRTCAI